MVAGIMEDVVVIDAADEVIDKEVIVTACDVSVVISVGSVVVLVDSVDSVDVVGVVDTELDSVDEDVVESSS